MNAIKALKNPLHLLRAILRECSYLPDEAARRHWHAYTLARFRKYCPRQFGKLKQEPRKPVIEENRRITLVKSAQDVVRLLQLANDGHVTQLEKVLAHTYGRAGKRRHELLAPLIEPDIPKNHEEVLELSASNGNANASKLQLSTKLMAVAKAQAFQSTISLSRPPIKQLEPRIPEINSWGRSFPVRRAKNLARNWYNDTLKKILPPLPLQEWERLRDLAHGKIVWPGPPPRRNKTGRVARRVNQSNPHLLTPRFMRRMWSSIFLQCPLLFWDPKKSSWTVKWGKLGKWWDSGESSTMTYMERSLFDGVSDTGRLLQRPVRSKTSIVADHVSSSHLGQ